jgi:N-acetylglucosaminyl-diphospho-decaprenol L-rhamnosyltransferase
MTSPVTLVTVSYFSSDDVETCLASVARASTNPPQLVVVNNAPTDDLQHVQARYPAVTLLNPGANLGYGGAVNFAVKTLAAARGADGTSDAERDGDGDSARASASNSASNSAEWILVTNPDVEFTPGSIDALLAVAQSDPRIGVVGPRITNDDGTIYPSARDLPSLTSGAGHAILHRIWPDNRWSKRYLRADKSKSSDTTPVASGWLSGACLLVRRSAFEQIGGFDDRFFMYFEDVDLGERLGLAGWKVLYVPTATVAHAGGTSTRSHSAAMLKAHHKSAYLYLAKRYHHWYQLPVRVALRVGLFIRGVLHAG